MTSPQENLGPKAMREQAWLQLNARAVVQIDTMLNLLIGELQTLKQFLEQLQWSQNLDAPCNSATQGTGELSASDLLETANRITNLSGRVRTLIYILRALLKTSENDPPHALTFFEEDLIYLERVNKEFPVVKT